MNRVTCQDKFPDRQISGQISDIQICDIQISDRNPKLHFVGVLERTSGCVTTCSASFRGAQSLTQAVWGMRRIATAWTCGYGFRAPLAEPVLGRRVAPIRVLAAPE